MCGIIGGNLFKDKEGLISSLKTISHRGTDNSDIKVFQSGMYLGHNRLSIQDLSPKSNQPFQSSCGRYHLVFNGELWKSTFDEWNDKLRKKYSFITDKSDTELLLYFLIEHRENLKDHLSNLNGMFAFGFYDSEKDYLIIGRDFIGRIPLYYYHDGFNIIFCSEKKGILKSNPNSGEEIIKLRGGDILHFNSIGIVKIESFYEIKRLPPHPDANYPKTEEQFQEMENDLGLDYYVKEFRRLLEKSVEDELISDVPLATILSGGIDSSIITYLLSKKVPNIECFVVSVQDDNQRKKKDDLHFARIMANFLGLKLTEVILTKKDIIKNIENGVLASEMDSSVQVSSTIPQMFLSSQIRKKGFKVVFGGDGADELFASYGDVKRFCWHLPHSYQKRKINLLNNLHDKNISRSNKTMMFGGEVELRTPFLSKELVEFSIKIPTKYRDEKDGKGKLMKYILRKAFEKDLPEEIINRPKKTFQVGCNSVFIKDEPYKSMINNLHKDLFVSPSIIKPLTEEKNDDLEDMMEIINLYPNLLPHLYKQKYKIKARIKEGRIFFDGNSLLVFRKYVRKTQFSINSNVIVKRGDFCIKHIVSNQLLRGNSKRLLNRFIDFCKENGGENIYLSVRTENKTAIRFYERNGFKFIDTTHWNENGKKLDGMIFSLQLKTNSSVDYSNVLLKDKVDLNVEVLSVLPLINVLGAYEKPTLDKSKIEILSVKFSKVGKKTLEDYPNLKTIITRSHGMDNINLNLTNRRNIKIIKTNPSIENCMNWILEKIKGEKIVVFGNGSISNRLQKEIKCDYVDTKTNKRKLKNLLSQTDCIISTLPQNESTNEYFNLKMAKQIKNPIQLISISREKIISKEFIEELEKNNLLQKIHLDSEHIAWKFGGVIYDKKYGLSIKKIIDEGI